MTPGSPQGGVPMFFGMPVPQPQQPRPEAREQVPTRVAVSVVVLEHLTRKADFEIAIWESGSERYDGMKLTDEELNLQAKACNLLISYIDGSYKPTKDEEKVRASKSAQAAGPGRIIGCVGCGGRGTQPEDDRQPCVLCHGSRYTLITPVNEP